MGALRVAGGVFRARRAAPRPGLRGLVYAVCLRETRDAALAEDAAQVVFLLLARKAASFGPDARFAGWLFRTARFAGKNARRRDTSRRLAEQRVGEQMLMDQPGDGAEDALWAEAEPGLNDALASLGARDREAVLLRFGQGLTFPELGAALGTSEDAARMRLTRALARLRRFFAGQGVPITAAILAALLAARTAHAAPDSLAASLSNLGLTALSPQVSIQLQGALKIMTLSKLKLAATVGVGAILAAGVPLVTLAKNHTKAKTNTRSARTFQQAVPTGKFPALELGSDFTLSYKVIEKDTRTSEERVKADQPLLNAEHRLVQQNLMKQADADQQRRSMEAVERLPLTPKQYLVTLSAHRGKLLYVSQQYGVHSYGLDPKYRPVVLPYEKKTVLYDGQKTYVIRTDKDQPNERPLLRVLAGFRADDLSDCLLPGVGLPSMPLAKALPQEDVNGTLPSAASPAKQSTRTGIACSIFSFAGNRYWHGMIYFQGDGDAKRLARVIVGSPDHPTEVWRFQKPQAFQNTWVSRYARHARFASPTFGSPPSSLPTKIEDYEITSLQKAPLTTSQFDIRTYLLPNMTVEEQRGTETRSFSYNPNGGDLETQSRAAVMQ